MYNKITVLVQLHRIYVILPGYAGIWERRRQITQKEEYNT
jgi:hypothetical protein